MSKYWERRIYNRRLEQRAPDWHDSSFSEESAEKEARIEHYRQHVEARNAGKPCWRHESDEEGQTAEELKYFNPDDDVAGERQRDGEEE